MYRRSFEVNVNAEADSLPSVVGSKSWRFNQLEGMLLVSFFFQWICMTY